MITKVSDTTALPKMSAVGYIGQSAEQLKADLAVRREQLHRDPKPEARLKCIGKDRYGDIYIDLDDWYQER